MMTIPILMAVALGAAPAAAEAPAPEPVPARTTFKCQTGGDLVAEFASRGAELVAIVDAGDGPHALPLRPWTGGLVKLTWSDGQRTLTWSPGVHILWTDGASQRVCGRGEHRHEMRPRRPVPGRAI